jgi:hypothetical protein
MITENSPNLGKEKDIQVHEAFRTPNGHEQKWKSPYIILKMPLHRTKKEYWKLKDISTKLHTKAKLSE